MLGFCVVITCADQVTDSAPGSTQPTIDSKLKRLNSSAHEIRLIRAIIAGARPLSMAEEPNLRELLIGLGYNPPCVKTVTAKVKDFYDIGSERLKKMLVDTGGTDICSLSVDGWLSPANVEFMAVVCHWVDASFRLHCRLLKITPVGGDTTAAHLQLVIEGVISEYGLNPHVIVSDSGANYVAAIRGMKRKGSRAAMERVVCTAHNLALVIHDTTKTSYEHDDEGMYCASRATRKSNPLTDCDVPTESKAAGQEYRELIEKCCTVTAAFSRSGKKTVALENAQVDRILPGQRTLKVVRECKTRWNSRLAMIERLIELHLSISAVPEVPVKLNRADLDAMRDIVVLLRPFKDVSEWVQGSKYITLSSLLPVYSALYQHVSQIQYDDLGHETTKIHTAIGQQLKTALLLSLEQRFSVYLEQKAVRFATYFDPRYRELWFLTAQQQTELLAEVAQLEVEYNLKSSQANAAAASAANAVALPIQLLGLLIPPRSATVASSVAAAPADAAAGASSAAAAAAAPATGIGSRPTGVNKRLVPDAVVRRSETDEYTKHLPGVTGWSNGQEFTCWDSTGKFVANSHDQKQTAANLSDTDNVLLWWREHERKLPLLSLLARKYLAVPASSAEPERIWSNAKLVCSRLRSSLSPERLEQLVFCKFNLDLVPSAPSPLH